MQPPVFRFAPSPNGRLHLGHAYSALLNARLALQSGGRFLLRIEDIDTTRCTPELAQECLNDLAWLGIGWEHPARVQSQHFADYAAALDRLRERGLLYPCFCSRKEIIASSIGTDPEGAPLYPGTCRHLSPEKSATRIAAGEAHSWRLDMEKALWVAPAPYEYTRFHLPERWEDIVQANPRIWGDVILARKDTPTSYHLSVVVDDARQGITHILRGQDLETATDIHVLLQRLFGFPTPLYHHHRLVQDAGGEKLAKSRGSETLADLRARGITPQELRAMLEPYMAGTETMR